MPRPHQVAADVLPGACQVAGGLLRHAADGDQHDVAKPEQPGQQQRVLGVGLDPVIGRPVQLARCGDDPPHVLVLQEPGQPEPGRPGLVGDRRRAGQLPQPREHGLRLRAQPGRISWPVSPSIAHATTDLACTSRPTHIRSRSQGPPDVRLGYPRVGQPAASVTSPRAVVAAESLYRLYGLTRSRGVSKSPADQPTIRPAADPGKSDRNLPTRSHRQRQRSQDRKLLHLLHVGGPREAFAPEHAAAASHGGLVMSLHKLSAGDGYTYLTRQVAVQDSTERGLSGLGEYYSEKGESPGVWLGRGTASLPGFDVSLPVGEAADGGVVRGGPAPGRRPD